MATLSDIAKRVNVSPAAISRILNRDPEFMASKSVRLAVMKAAVDLGYRTPRQRKRGKSTIEVAVADWHIVPSCRSSEFDYSSIIPLADSKVDYVFSRLERDNPRFVDAVIAVGAFTKEEIEEMMFSSTNIVFINSCERDVPFDTITIDYAAPVRKTVDYLMERGLKRIGFISGISEENGIAIGKGRIDVIEEIMREKGVFDPELFGIGDLTDESGYRMAGKIVQKKPDAIILGTQLVENGVFDYLKTLSNPPLVILSRDVDFSHERASYPCIRFASEQLWRITLMLIYLRSRDYDPPLSVTVEGEFDTSDC